MDNEEGLRLYLQTLLEENFPGLGVYYRPPGNIILQRPCIIYESQQAEPTYANNLPYVIGTRFQVTVLSDLPGYSSGWTMFRIPGIVVVSNQSYVNKDVVHDVYTVSVNTI